jgi:hypothetical protein
VQGSEKAEGQKRQKGGKGKETKAEAKEWKNNGGRDEVTHKL